MNPQRLAQVPGPELLPLESHAGTLAISSPRAVLKIQILLRRVSAGVINIPGPGAGGLERVGWGPWRQDATLTQGQSPMASPASPVPRWDGSIWLGRVP